MFFPNLILIKVYKSNGTQSWYPQELDEEEETIEKEGKEEVVVVS